MRDESLSTLKRYLKRLGLRRRVPHEYENRDLVRDEVPLDETQLDAVSELIELRGFHHNASTSGTRRSDVAASDKDKQICFMLMSKT